MCKNLKKEQIDVAFKKFDQTGNDKLNIKASTWKENKIAGFVVFSQYILIG